MAKWLPIIALLSVAIAMGLSLAHALGFPGKLRLDREAYEAVQTIYYPGFTWGGLIGEVGGMLALALLLVFGSHGTERFWWTAAALCLLMLGHGVYWLMTHPVNNFWVKDLDLSGPAATFFSLHAGEGRDGRRLRDIWEYSHVIRAGLAMASLFSLAVAVTR